MKPKDLKFPYSWEMRKPLLEKGVFYIPQYYSKHHHFHFPNWDQKELFGNDHPVYVEYCSGNGEWIIKKALSFPHLNWVAVEKKFERVRKIVSKRTNQKISNLFVVCGDALTFTQMYLKEACLDGVYVHFPDPWPKERHAKHRLIQKPFALELKQKIKKLGCATFVTDSLPYHMFISLKVLSF